VIIPPACPEIPVAKLAPALAYYRDSLGFSIDWADEEHGLAGVSQGHCRLFLASARHRSGQANTGPIVIWLNLSGRDEIDALFERWSATGARIAEPPAAKPWKLYEFFARDLDGNVLRVFYDFAWEEREAAQAN
jgi:uncharacterized glyoxalase superfamily protein PhnB